MKPIARWMAVVFPAPLGPKSKYLPFVDLEREALQRCNSGPCKAPVFLADVFEFQSEGHSGTFYSQTGKRV